jgi:hypothetical protein
MGFVNLTFAHWFSPFWEDDYPSAQLEAATKVPASGTATTVAKGPGELSPTQPQKMRDLAQGRPSA